MPCAWGVWTRTAMNKKLEFRSRPRLSAPRALREKETIMTPTPKEVAPHTARLLPEELAIVRRAYAKQMLAAFGVTDPRVEAAFAAVRREAHLGPGPWPIWY